MSNNEPQKYVIKNEEDFQQAHVFIHALIDAGAYDEKHVLAPLLSIIGDAVYEYENN